MNVPNSSEEAVRARVRAFVAAATRPVTFKAIASAVKAEGATLSEALEAEVREGRAHRWPDFRKSQYFWSMAPQEKAREAILAAAGTCAIQKAALIKTAAGKVPGFTAKRVEAEVAALLAEKKLQTVPGFSGAAKLLVRAGAQEAYFQAARAFLERKIRGAGFDPAALFARRTAASDAPRAIAAGDMILDAIRSLEPVRGVPVSTLRLRNHFPRLSKAEFDAAALALRRGEQAHLSKHAEPDNLSQEEKDLLIDGQDGTYYISISIR